VAHSNQDDAFHEIQLNGKQLFFLFMAATVVSVVIFLSGVLVGRGVRTERGAVAENQALNLSPTADEPQATSGLPPTAAGADLTKVPPPPPADEIGNVQPTAAPVEDVKPPAPKAPDTQSGSAATPGTAGKPVPPAPAPRSTPPAPAAAAKTPAAGSSPAAARGWVVQVSALNAQSEAQTYAADLNRKGFEAFVVSPQPGTSVYRVRVGPFGTKGEADAEAARLAKSGYKSWVTR
jgi:cell division septation protein DedD